MTPETCPHCGAAVPAGARACPECGSDETTGWSEEARESDLGLPEETFDYKDYVNREFNAGQVRPRGIHWIWWLTALLLLVVLIGAWLR